ncbi:hypothetical protein LCGC14_1807910 [marine sediment metagenome]|uniref:Uncharacterized protein n=1 Tax=marine sediment metagenome TaxID=412755 RepID=A0A0F9JMC0_9ZZZZ
MKAYGVGVKEIQKAIEAANHFYGGNIQEKRLDAAKHGAVFTLTVKDSAKPGHRLGHARNGSGQRRRIAAACWHVHRDVLTALFQQNPEARVKSMQADYTSKQNFEESFESSGLHNAGSMADPIFYQDLCDCEE